MRSWASASVASASVGQGRGLRVGEGEVRARSYSEDARQRARATLQAVLRAIDSRRRVTPRDGRIRPAVRLAVTRMSSKRRQTAATSVGPLESALQRGSNP